MGYIYDITLTKAHTDKGSSYMGYIYDITLTKALHIWGIYTQMLIGIHLQYIYADAPQLGRCMNRSLIKPNCCAWT